MTIAVSQNPESQQNLVSSSKNKSKLGKRKMTWAEKKIDLVNKRLMFLSQMDQNRENVNADKLVPNLYTNDAWKEPQNAPKLMSNVCANTVHDEPENTIVPCLPSQSKVKTASEPHRSVGVSISAMDRALKVQGSLPKQYPSFLKLMSRSHVSGGFWLGLPKDFCNLHMPDKDTIVVLVDENGKGYETKYLVNKTGLSGGWRGFSIAQGLMESDVVIFQLTEPFKFKVYVIRAGRLTQADGALVLMNLDSGTKPVETESKACLEADEQNYSELLLALDNHNDSNVNSEVHEGIRFSESELRFEDIKKFEDFAIHVDGLIIDSEIPPHVRRKYCELCCSQNMFLHRHFIEGLNVQLISGVISETVNIADAIRQVKPSTSVNGLESWEKTLKAFEDLGMVVGFLRARIQKLLSLSQDSKAAIELKGRERADAESEMRCLTEKLHGVGALIKKLDAEIDDLIVKDEDIESVFAEAASASW